MAITITSFSPATGPTTGGTIVTVIGTGLDTVTDVEFGAFRGTINQNPPAPNSPTLLSIIAPGIPNASAGAMKISLIDTVGSVITQTATNYTYTVVTTPQLTSTTASKYILRVDTSVAQDGSAFVPVRGITDFKPSVATTTQDDSDYDSGVWGSDAKTQLKWSCVLKLSRKRASSYVEDPGQKQLRLAHDQVGAGGSVLVQWYDRNGHGSEAFQGTALVEWDDDGGPTSALSTVSCTLMGQGVRTPITNPVS